MNVPNTYLGRCTRMYEYKGHIISLPLQDGGRRNARNKQHLNVLRAKQGLLYTPLELKC